MSKITKWQKQAKNLAELHERVSKKGIRVVPRPTKEELNEAIAQAQKNADRVLSNRFPKHVKL